MKGQHANDSSSKSKGKIARGADLSESQEAEFNFGYFYRTLEEHVNAYAAQEGNPHSVTDIAVRVGRLLEAKAIREQLGSPELVSQVRQNGAATRGRKAHAFGYGLAETALHVRPRNRRTLSPEARERIATAQRKRWAKSKRVQKAKAGGKTRSGEAIVPWTAEDDALIVNAAKGGATAAPELARSLTFKLKGRTEGAIRQRMARLVAKGSLKQSKGKRGDGGVPHFMVEAA